MVMLVALAEGDLQHDGDQVRFRRVIFPQVTVRRGAGRVEVAQGGVGEPISRGVVRECPFDDEFGEAVRIDRLLPFVFRNRNSGRESRRWPSCWKR